MQDSFEHPIIADKAAQAAEVAEQVKRLKAQRPEMVEYLLKDVAGDYVGTSKDFAVWSFWYFRRNVHMDDLRELGSDKHQIKDWVVAFCNVAADDDAKLEVFRKKLSYRRDKGAEIEGVKLSGGGNESGKVTELFAQVEKYLFGGKDKSQTRVARLTTLELHDLAEKITSAYNTAETAELNRADDERRSAEAEAARIAAEVVAEAARKQAEEAAEALRAELAALKAEMESSKVARKARKGAEKLAA